MHFNFLGCVSVVMGLSEVQVFPPRMNCRKGKCCIHRSADLSLLATQHKKQERNTLSDTVMEGV